MQQKRFFKKLFSFFMGISMCLSSIPIGLAGSSGMGVPQPVLAEEADNNCYISNFAIRETSDGLAPFDKDDGPGNDSSNKNHIVRSFDNINYDLEYITALKDLSTTVDSAYARFEFRLNLDPSEAVFNSNTFLWAEDTKTTYMYEDGTSSQVWDQSKKVVQQILTGKRLITNNADVNAIPGMGTLSFGIKVKGAKNGSIVQPSFKLWIEGNSTYKEITADAVRVSAEPRYNIMLTRFSTSSNADPLVYMDPATKELSTEKKEGYIKGRMQGYTVTLQLRNIDTAKGLKGIELPTNSMRYKIKVKETLNGVDVTNQPNYTPVYYDAAVNSPGARGNDGHSMTIFGDNYTSAVYSLPYAFDNNFKRNCNQTWDNGKFTITPSSEPNVYDCLSNEYSFDLDQYHFPWNHIHTPTSQYINFPENIGIFSMGTVHFLAQFPEEVSETANITMEAEVIDMEAESISGQKTAKEMIETDNRSATQVTLYPRGSYSSRDVWSSTTTYGSGDASTFVGSNVTSRYRGSVHYAGDIPLTSYNYLQKFDDTVYEPTGTWSVNPKGNPMNIPGKATWLWAAKPDKSGWKNDQEMNDAKEENLIYFDDLETLRNAGYTCVGYLLEVRDGKYYSVDGTASQSFGLKVKDDAEIGKVAMIKCSSRAWTGSEIPMSWTDIPFKDEAYGLGDTNISWGSPTYSEGYLRPRYEFNLSYKKSTYKDGTVSGGHTNGHLAGNSMLILGDRTSVLIAPENKKATYDMDNNERIATFVITPKLELNANIQNGAGTTSTDTVTIKTVLPKEMKYRLNSASIAPSSVTENADGTSTILWTLENQIIGEGMNPVTFQVDIGKAGDKEDVVNMQQLTVKSYISSLQDTRIQNAYNGNYSETAISIIKLATCSISKSVDKPLNEVGGDFTFSLNLGNTSQIPLENLRLYDVMPFDEDDRGTHFHGGYRIDSITLDFKDAPKTFDSVKDTTSLLLGSDTSYQSDPKASDILSSAPKDSVGGWKKISSRQVKGNTIIYTMTETPVSLYIALGGNMEGNEFLKVHIHCTPLDASDNFIKDSSNMIQQPEDLYANSFYEYADNQIAVVQSNVVKTTVVSRAISGLVWVDSDSDGVRQETEDLLSNKTVRLFRTSPSENGNNKNAVKIGDLTLYPAYDLKNKEVQPTTTNTDGTYRFTNLENGTYVVIIDDLLPYQCTAYQNIADKTLDNDGIKNENKSGLMKNAAILNIDLPSIEQMTGSFYESEHNDLGVIRILHERVAIEKIWDDNNNQDGIRPEKIDAILTQNKKNYESYELNEENNWHVQINNLPKYDDNGERYIYGIAEVPVNGYKQENYASGASTGTDAYIKYTLKNTHKPDKISLSGQKIWDDNNNQDGIRPNSIVVELYDGENKVAEKTVTASDGWKYTFENLDKNRNGEEIIYTVREQDVPGYTPSYSGMNITNLHQAEKTSVTVEKKWEDNDNQDGIRPLSVRVSLFADGDDTGKSVLLSTDNHWIDCFADLDKYKAGKEIEYTVQETSVPNGYTSSVRKNNSNVWEIVNTHIPDVTIQTVTKVWQDDNDRDGIRPDFILVSLYKNGEKYDETQLDESNGWKAVFDSLPKYSNQALINWTIGEEPVAGYTTKVDKIGNDHIITNVHTPALRSLPVEKMWNDNDNQDGLRPDSVSVALVQNGIPTQQSLELSEENKWQASFKELYKYEGGKEIDYSVQENVPTGYEESYKKVKDGYQITNSHKSETIELSVQKIWDDDNNRDGVRPASIAVTLYGDGLHAGWATLSDSNNWSEQFADLPKYKAGKEIIYTIEENTVNGYDKNIETTDTGFILTNTHEPERISISGNKHWQDDNDRDGVRPESISVAVYNGNNKIQEQTITAQDNWHYTFDDLLKYENGHEIIYSIQESPVEGYNTIYHGTDIINSREPEQTNVNVRKVWDDNDNQDGIRPDYITVRLLENGQDTGKTCILSSNSRWMGGFYNLPKYDQGQEIQYSIEEVDVPVGYIPSIAQTDGVWTITNTHTPETMSLSIEKEWDDNNNQDGIRPQTIEVVLFNQDTPIRSLILSEEEGWQGTFDDLPRYTFGQENEWKIQEKKLEGYENNIEKTSEGFRIINTHIPGTTSLHIKKQWKDRNNFDKIRPDSIQIDILKEDKVIKTVELKASNQWEYWVENLEKYENGTEIRYTIQEHEVEGYRSSLQEKQSNDWIITNEHTLNIKTDKKPDTPAFPAVVIPVIEENIIQPVQKTVESVQTGLATPSGRILAMMGILGIIAGGMLVYLRKHLDE